MILGTWKLCNMDFESGVVPHECRIAETAQLYKGKEERTECKNYRGINFFMRGWKNPWGTLKGQCSQSE